MAAVNALGLQKLGAWNVQDPHIQDVLRQHAKGRLITRGNVSPDRVDPIINTVKHRVVKFMGGGEPNKPEPRLFDPRVSPFYKIPIHLVPENRVIAQGIGRIIDPEDAYANPRRRLQNVTLNTFYGPHDSVRIERDVRGKPIPHMPSDAVRDANPIMLGSRGVEPFHALSDPKNLREVLQALATNGNLDLDSLVAHPYIANKMPGYENIFADTMSDISKYEQRRAGSKR